MISRYDDYDFSPEKNALLKEERGVSFDEVIAAIESGQVLDLIEHTNQKKYSRQDIYVVLIDDYVYMVPFVEKADGSFFLKTIYPSRKMTKIYLSGGLYAQKK